VLVYDLGGGTFDTTVLRLDAGGVAVIAVDGDSQLGGADWDERLADHLTERFVDAVGGEVDDAADELFAQHTMFQAEAAKRALSTATRRQVRLRCLGRTVTVTVDRNTLREITADLVDRTMAIVARTLEVAATKGVPRIDEVVLVGGSTRMPAIAAAVVDRLDIQPRLVEPDFAVAFGAAIRAHQLADEPAMAGPARAGGALARIADAPAASVVPRSFGVLLADSHDPAAERRFVHHIVHRNERLPVSGTAVFATIVPGQDRIRVQVFEQAGDVPSAEVPDNRRVLDGELLLPGGLPAGAPIEITLRVDANGLLDVTARDRTGGGALTLQAYVDGVVDATEARRLADSLTGLTVRQ
jgi:molecular chaperone DnaK (HSP70)